MRSGGSLSSTVLLLLLLGLATWAVRHWKPDFICNNSAASWFCGSQANVAGNGSGKTSSSTGGGYSDSARQGGGSKTVAALPWPVADSPRKWSNFRDGAYDIPSVAATPAPAAAPVAAAIPWPIADQPIKWTNFRSGAYSVAAAPAPSGGAIPWPIADKPIKWSNFRAGAYGGSTAAATSATGNVTVAHPFPWPVAEKPVTWTNVRKPAAAKKIVAKSQLSKTVAHPFPWPVADAPRKWTNVRGSGSAAAAPAPKATGVAHPFPWPVADAPRKWTNVRSAPAKSAAPKRASDCGAALNRVARSGVILFETASARLKRSSYVTLDQLAGVAKTCDRVSITVEGHTDDRGRDAFNQGLSEQRAQSVAAYLKGAGVPGNSLKAVGYGETRPAVPNNSAANRAKNRRIEFSVSGQ